ncbi:hypothetical protein AB0H29_04500 [Streptomyces thermolilacinus]
MNIRHMLGVAEDARRKKVLELRRDGFEVLSDEQASKLVGGRVEAVPDLIARRGDEVVIVEFAQRQPDSALPDKVKDSLAFFSAISESKENWRFEMVWIGEDSAVPEERAVESFAHRAVQIAKHDEAAGLLLAYAALEGAISRLVERTPELREQYARRRRPGLAELTSLGLLSPEDFNKLNSARQARNSISHGIDVPVSFSMVEELATMAERLADARYVSIDQMVDWFFEHYEDPANGVPYVSSEGGYQYVLGGPYDAHEVLAEKFPDASPDDIEEAVKIVQSEAYEWVEKGVY